MTISSLASYTTVNSGSSMTVSLASVSHVIEHSAVNQNNDDSTETTCWIHFDSGKSVHVRESLDNISYDLEEYHKTHH